MNMASLGTSVLTALIPGLLASLLGQDKSMPIKNAFDVFGIDDASDIISITPVKTDNTWTANGKMITDKTIISNFYIEISLEKDIRKKPIIGLITGFFGGGDGEIRTLASV